MCQAVCLSIASRLSAFFLGNIGLRYPLLLLDPSAHRPASQPAGVLLSPPAALAQAFERVTSII